MVSRNIVTVVAATVLGLLASVALAAAHEEPSGEEVAFSGEPPASVGTGPSTVQTPSGDTPDPATEAPSSAFDSGSARGPDLGGAPDAPPTTPGQPEGLPGDIGAAPADPATGDAGDSPGEDVRPAPVVIDPLLATFETGSGVGGPVVCSTVAGVTGPLFSFLPEEVASEVNNALVTFARACNDGARSASTAIGDARTQAEAAAVLNDAVRPSMLAFAEALHQIHDEYADSIAPFGFIVELMAESVEYYAGPG